MDMPESVDDKLVVAISSRALFELEDADRVFSTEGLDSYRRHQRDHEQDLLTPGTGVPLVRSLLAINQLTNQRLVEVVIVSRNDPDTGLRVVNSLEGHGLEIQQAVFTAGADPLPYLDALGCNLFLSVDASTVRGALERGMPAAQVLEPPAGDSDMTSPGALHIAFDGDSVLVDGESDRVFDEQGVEAFIAHEVERVDIPMSPGPFQPFLLALGRVQSALAGQPAVKISLVTARNASAGRRFVHTFRHWGVNVDESFFLAGAPKAPILSVLRPHIYFDDRHEHLGAARAETPSAHVPFPDISP